MRFDDFLQLSAASTPESVERVEAELGAPLPDSFRRFLLTCDGGRPHPNMFDTPMGRPAGVGVTTFLGVAGERDTILARCRDYAGRIGEHMIPIADAEGGNLVAISIGGDEVGSVWFWDHELEADEGDPPRPEALTWLAPDFDAFFEALQVDGDPDADEPSVLSSWIDPQFLAEVQRDQDD
jgi:hypothetical protein